MKEVDFPAENFKAAMQDIAGGFHEDALRKLRWAVRGWSDRENRQKLNFRERRDLSVAHRMIVRLWIARKARRGEVEPEATNHVADV